jgi:hypothetical protein
MDKEKKIVNKDNTEIDLTGEIVKFYNTDPISKSVIDYLLKKHGVIMLDITESIRLHREIILLNIVRIYKQMWDARSQIMQRVARNKGKPVKLVIKERKVLGEDNGNGKDKKEVKK